MKSSTGQYYVGLDHIRAVAAFMVFASHFIHIHDGQFSPLPYFPLSLLSEGHTGVALFMTLSGYLFAKLLDGRDINFASFLWNRFLRLGPLLMTVILFVGFAFGADPLAYAKSMLWGLIKPVWPNGGWSITVEFHFYLFLPLLLYVSKKSSYFLLLFIAGMIVFRLFLYQELGEIQTLAYYTIVGRIDQFILGILAYQYRDLFKGKHVVALAIFLSFAVFYWYFDSLGGFYKNPGVPSPSPIWIYMTTAEGVAYASLIAWYDLSFNHTLGRLSRFIARIGTYSYSIYLLHYFFVFLLAYAIDKYLFSLANIYVAMMVSPIAFLLMIPLGWLSYRFIESPFLKFRTQYILATVAR